jgi:hypothetical protein
VCAIPDCDACGDDPEHATRQVALWILLSPAAP